MSGFCWLLPWMEKPHAGTLLIATPYQIYRLPEVNVELCCDEVGKRASMAFLQSHHR